MARENLQTIIVSKQIASTRKAAEKLARPYANRIYTSRATDSSWMFRQRPSSDFVNNSCRSFPLPSEPGIVLVYGKLKHAANPSGQRWLQFKEGGHHEVVVGEFDFWMSIKPAIEKSKDAESLRKIISSVDKREIKSSLVRGLIDGDIADRARALKITRAAKSTSADERVVRSLRRDLIGNPYSPPTKKKNNKKLKKTNKKKSSKKKAPTYIKLKSPKQMPDPGPCPWLGSIIEFGWEMDAGESSKKIDEHGNALWDPRSEWMFMWSPKYKAVVGQKRPRNMYQLADVSRYGGAAKMFEVFMARPAENTFELTVPDVPLHKVGKSASHIVYRSDKWSPKRLESDYIHQFGKGVQLYCGPSIEHPEVFICYGGKLTLTRRGLVW